MVNNDTPNRSTPGTPGINTMEINTKLLVADGDIVVIGGIKKNNVASSKSGCSRCEQSTSGWKFIKRNNKKLIQ